MKSALIQKMGVYLLFAGVLLGVGIGFMSCRQDEPVVPPLTGPSGQKLFLTMTATPDHLKLVPRGGTEQISHITAQLKNQLGQGVNGEHIRLQIHLGNGQTVALGMFEGSATCHSGPEAECQTDSGGFVRADYVAPFQDSAPASTRVYIFALMTNPEFTFQVTDQHALDLELGTNPGPGGNCGPGGLDPSFTVTPVAPITGEEVCFDASGSGAVSPVLSAKWDFGDGHKDSTSGLRPCHVYHSAGLFNVELTLSDQDTNVCSTIQSLNVTNGLPPVCGSLIQNPGGALATGVPYEFTELNATDPDSTIKNYTWDFNDNSRTVKSTSNTIVHTFKNEGSFTLLLTLTDTQGNQTVCTSVLAVGTVSGNAPTCGFSASPTSPAPGDTVNFNATASTDDGSVVSYTWDFGDGNPIVTESDPLISHSFTAAGTYTVTLIVTDNDGNSSACTQTVTVTAAPPPPANTPPTCSFTISPVGGTTATTFNYNASASTDSDGSIVNYSWDYGDGSAIVNEADPIPPGHSYASAATFVVVLTVTDNSGANSTCTKNVVVAP